MKWTQTGPDYLHFFTLFIWFIVFHLCATFVAMLQAIQLNSLNHTVTVHDSPSDKFLLRQLEQILEETCGRL